MAGASRVAAIVAGLSRTRYRQRLVEFVTEQVRGETLLRFAAVAARHRAAKHITEPDRARFAELAEGELLGLHEGNFARFRLRPSEFDAWRMLQDEDPPRHPR